MDIGQKGHIFGIPCTPEQAKIVLLPVPWDVTVSYREGTALGPQAVLDASSQLDVFHPDMPDFQNIGVTMLPISKEWLNKRNRYRPQALKIIEALEKGQSPADIPPTQYQEINTVCEELMNSIQISSAPLLEKGKWVGLVGGDHSVSLGLCRAISERVPEFGVLQIDAHMDLRPAYEGFVYSHASIMRHISALSSVKTLVQVGVRDFSSEEYQFASYSNGKIFSFPDFELRQNQFEGTSWKKSCERIVEPLPSCVYISFDIDGLQRYLCPNTGTPVPGGLDFSEAMFLIREVARSGRKIIGFDVVEVGPSETEWDGNVGARILFHLCGFMAKSQGK